MIIVIRSPVIFEELPLSALFHRNPERDFSGIRIKVVPQKLFENSPERPP